MDINTMTTDYTNYINQAKSTDVTNQLSNVKPKDSSDEEMLEACKQFETYMVEQIFKQMQKTVKMTDDEDTGGYGEYLDDFQAQQYAQMVTEQGKLGLAQQLYESMKLQSKGISPQELQNDTEGNID